MHWQTFGAIIGIIIGILSSVSILIAIPVFFYRRGAHDEDTTNALKAITDANRAMAEAHKALADDYRSFRERTIEVFHEHDLRIVRLEPHSNGNSRRR